MRTQSRAITKLNVDKMIPISVDLPCVFLIRSRNIVVAFPRLERNFVSLLHTVSCYLEIVSLAVNVLSFNVDRIASKGWYRLRKRGTRTINIE